MNSSILENWHRSGLLSTTDLYFAGFLEKLDGGGDPLLPVAAALVNRFKADGHVCLDLRALSEKKSYSAAYQAIFEALPQEDEWNRRLRKCAVVGRPEEYCPLVLDDSSRLYLYRYWQSEKRLADAVIMRSASIETTDECDQTLLRNGLERLFPENDAGMGIDWQKIAAAVAVLKQFCVITGGPGTGKTHTVAKILALLLEQQTGAGMRIRLAAPTGKAAAKLGESLRKVKATLECRPEIRACIPEEATTIHRLLQARPSAPGFTFHGENRLPVDVVVVDEASMIDLALMAKLVQALPDRTRLILIGDKDQLASVEAGSVLGDICDRRQAHGLSANFKKQVEELTGQVIAYSERVTSSHTGIQDNIVHLNRSYRFNPDSGIGALSRAVNTGETDAAVQMLRSGTEQNVQMNPIDSMETFLKQLGNTILQGYRAYLNIDQPEKALEAFQRFRILCAVRKGPFGVDSINRLSEQVLKAHRLIRLPAPGTGAWYHGRPVLITHNDYKLGLYNGDIGLTRIESTSLYRLQGIDPNRVGAPGIGRQPSGLADSEGRRQSVKFEEGRLPAGGQRTQVLFGESIEHSRRIPAYRIGRCETVYAMTVHKSQGSEFDQIHLVLPNADNPMLTRELIYTAITRARQKVCIWGTEKVLRSALNRRIRRTSGLRDALWLYGQRS